MDKYGIGKDGLQLLVRKDLTGLMFFSNHFGCKLAGFHQVFAAPN